MTHLAVIKGEVACCYKKVRRLGPKLAFGYFTGCCAKYPEQPYTKTNYTQLQLQYIVGARDCSTLPNLHSKQDKKYLPFSLYK